MAFQKTMSSMSDKFSLKWNEFQQNINSTFKELQEYGDFSDVTLVCEEDQQVEAHRVIISACSPIFKNILKNNKHNHPLIYMRGLKANDLFAIIDFMYSGETSIPQGDLKRFLALAQELQLKGLEGVNNEQESKHHHASVNNIVSRKIEDSLKVLVPVKLEETLIKEENVISPEVDQDKSSFELEMSDKSIFGEELLPKPNNVNTVLSMNFDLDGQISSMMQKVEGKWCCKVCVKSSNQKCRMTTHIESEHIQGVTHTCNQCGKTSRTRNKLYVHVNTHHKLK